MNYAEVEAMTSPETAGKLQDDNYVYDCFAGRGQAVDAAQLDETIRGAVILGVEPVDYPLTDGLYLYIKPPAGEVIALYIAAENAGRYTDFALLQISKAAIT